MMAYLSVQLAFVYFEFTNCGKAHENIFQEAHNEIRLQEMSSQFVSYFVVEV